MLNEMMNDLKNAAQGSIKPDFVKIETIKKDGKIVPILFNKKAQVVFIVEDASRICQVCLTSGDSFMVNMSQEEFIEKMGWN